MALILGLMLTAIEMVWSAGRERGKAERLGQEIMELLDGAAAVAVWNFDPDLGRRVVQDAMTLDAVQGFELLYRNRDVLASSHRDKVRDSVLGGLVFGDLTVMEQTLYRPRVAGFPLEPGSEAEPIGYMRIHFDLSVISEDLWAFLLNSLVSGIVRNMLLGLALTLVFNRSLTRPLMALGRSIEAIDPTRPEDGQVALPPGHAQDELGAIAGRVNELLGRLTTVQADLRRLSTRDPLTRLANRALFEEGLIAAMVRSRRSGRRLAIMSVLMQPEAVRLGGDQAILHVANRLRDCVRSADLVARLGSEEFVAILSDVDVASAMRLADRIVSGLVHGLPIADRRIDNTPAIGIALHPVDGDDPDTLVTKARDAARTALEGGESIRFATREMIDTARDYLARAEAIMTALEEDKVVVGYQPQIDVAAGGPVALVAIPHWNNHGTVLEGYRLVAAAEEIGLDVAVLDHVLRTVVADMSRHDPGLPVVVRCVMRQMADPEFPKVVWRARQEAGLEAGRLVLLVPQDVGESPERRTVLQSLRSAGVELWLDVQRPDALAMGVLTDAAFTALELAAPPAGSDLSPSIESILGMADRLGRPVSVRMVDGAAQWALFVRAGCKRLRGPGIGKPVPLSELGSVLATLGDRAGTLQPGAQP